MDDVLQMLTAFGGIALVIWVSARAKVERIKAERQMWQPPAAQQPFMPQNDAVLAELRAMKQQMAEMQSTSHQFDLSFDAALNRLEDRVSRVETKTASVSPSTSETEPLRNGTH